MSAFLRTLAASVLALAFAAAIPISGQSRPSFGLGVLRRDGVLIPFGSYNGRSWSADWPGPNSDAVFPISLRDVPRRWWGAPGPDAPWAAWLLGETAPKPLALQKPAHTRTFCATQLGVQTDFQAGGFDPREPTIPKAGLAIAGSATLLPIVPVSLLSADAKRMVGILTADFFREESAAAARFSQWIHPFGELTRLNYPIELEAFYRARESSPDGEFMTSYIEAVRRFPAREEDQGCGLITFVRGWVIERPGSRPVIDIGARITYCDRADVSFMLPFGRLLIDRQPYWVYQISSWRDEVYSVSRATPTEVRPVLAVAGGGCPKNAPPSKPGHGGMQLPLGYGGGE